MKKFFVLLFLVLFICFVSAEVSIEPFVSVPNGKLVMHADEPYQKISIYAYYNLKELVECKPSTCPFFDNQSLSVQSGEEHKITLINARPGNYLVKVVLDADKNDFYFTSFVVRTDYSPYLGFAIIIIIIALALVEFDVIKIKDL
ncbi:MAG: hypothetical protein AB1467_06195 [Candidatus Diapherotrites archaeon]